MKITFSLNGRWLEVETPPDRRVVDLLREDLGLGGTKECCGSGECGACTILVDGESRLSCLMLAAQLEAIAMQHLSGLGWVSDEAVRLAAVEVERVDPDNLCHPLGKDCQQGVKIPLPQQLLKLLISILPGQRREPLHLLYPLLDAVSEAVQ